MPPLAQPLGCAQPVEHALSVSDCTERDGHAAAAADPSLDFVLIHLDVPHDPAIYDRHSGRIDLTLHRRDWYLDNLALADRALGELRRSMEAAGTWDSTVLLVSSDHHWRAAAEFGVRPDPRVPFVLRFPGEPGGLSYQGPVQTVVSGALLLEVLRGRVRSAREAAQWLDSQTQRASEVAGGPGP